MNPSISTPSNNWQRNPNSPLRVDCWKKEPTHPQVPLQGLHEPMRETTPRSTQKHQDASINIGYFWKQKRWLARKKPWELLLPVQIRNEPGKEKNSRPAKRDFSLLPRFVSRP